MRMLGGLLALMLVGCGASWPDGWGRACDETDVTSCGVGWYCASQGRAGDGRCEPACTSDTCSEAGWRCYGTVCRLPCGTGLGDCPTPGVCDERLALCVPPR